MRHTVIIPSYNTLPHLKNAISSLYRYAPDVDIIVIDDASTDGTAEYIKALKVFKAIVSKERRGHTYWYDEGMRLAQTEIVSILHSDMIIGPGYFENMLKHLRRGKVVCATRIEPPIHPAGREKIVRNFGIEAEEFKFDAFEKFVRLEMEESKNVTTSGIFAPWMLYKDDHLSIGGHDQRFAPYGYEDSDIFNRWILNGYEMVQSRDALCYHMTCRGHRWNAGVGIENSDYKDTMERCRKEYIRKWGDWIQNDEFQMPIINPKYNRQISIFNGNKDLLALLEPWADVLYYDGIKQDVDNYLLKEQPNTVADLAAKFNSQEQEADIIIRVNGKTFNQQDYTFIQQLAAILEANKPESGKFSLGTLEIQINKYYEEEIHSRVYL
jgi:GT2 family glycosyltransferase